MNNNKNLLLTIVLSALVLVGWEYFVAMPQMKADQARQAAAAKLEKKPEPAANVAVPAMSASGAHMTRAAALQASGPRVALDTPMLDGSILLKGAKLDDLRLKKYRESPDPRSPEIVLLAPKGTEYPYYAQFGWIGGNAMPDDRSVWTQQGTGTLSPGHPVTLSWDNGHGFVFTRVIAVDDKYMFSITDSVANKTGAAATLYPFADVARENVPPQKTSYVMHLGFVGVANGSEIDGSYSDFKDPGTPAKAFSSTGGWVGITDPYWMAAVIPPQGEAYNGEYLGNQIGAVKAYQADYRLGARNIAPGTSASVTHHLFAGAKVVDILKLYEHQQGVTRFTNAVDWGWFWFITQPLFWLLDQLYKLLGNFGLAILGLTVVLRAVFFPLANSSFKSMSKMKMVAPEVERLKKAHADDQQKLQAATMELYKREKINPLSSCLPMLIQIPVFFSLYKVLYVTIEMRQAPFFGWIHDLSSADPTSILNLFGLLPYHIPAFVPAYLSIGIWPILYGMTQFVQTKLNPPMADPVQAKMFTFMPLIFTFFFASLASGLVIYYTWSNLLGIAQQWFIMSRQGVKVHLFEDFKRKPPPK